MQASNLKTGPVNSMEDACRVCSYIGFCFFFVFFFTEKNADSALRSTSGMFPCSIFPLAEKKHWLHVST